MTARQPKRKIVQIASASAGSSHEMYTVLYGLADDGSLWIWNVEHQVWKPKAKGLPQ